MSWFLTALSIMALAVPDLQLTVKVTAEDGSPIAAAEVRLNNVPGENYTDAAGEARFAFFDPETLSGLAVTASKEGYLSVTRDVVWGDGSLCAMTLTLPVDRASVSVVADDEAPAVYYDLQGRRIADPAEAAPGSLLIRLRDGKASKILVPQYP